MHNLICIYFSSLKIKMLTCNIVEGNTTGGDNTQLQQELGQLLNLYFLVLVVFTA